MTAPVKQNRSLASTHKKARHMDLKVNIDPEEINRMVAQAVLDSALGNAINDAVTEQIKSFSATYNNPLAPAIRSFVHQQATAMLEEAHGDAIRAAIRESLTPERIKEMSDRFVLKMVSSLYD